MQEMVIYGVSFDMVGKQPIVLLKTADGNKFLPIWIGHPEAAAILMKLQGASTPRPMTHDLLSEMPPSSRPASSASRSPSSARTRSTPSITVGGERKRDRDRLAPERRPSPWPSVPMRRSSPTIRSSRRGAIEFEHEDDVNEEQMVEEFKKFLDDVKPEDSHPRDLAQLALGELEERRVQLPQAAGPRAGRRSPARARPGAPSRGPCPGSRSPSRLCAPSAGGRGRAGG